MDIMKTVNEAKDVVLNPKGSLQKLKDKRVTTKDIILYLAIVGAPTFLGVLIGYGIFSGFGTYFLGYAIALAILQYVLAIIGILVFGFIFNALAPSFKSKENKMQAMKLVAYAATPWLLLGIVNIYPPAALIALLGGLYGLYILYLGIPIFMETPKEQQMPYLIVGIIIYFVIMAVIWWITGWIWCSLVWSAVWGAAYSSWQNFNPYGSGTYPWT